MGRTDGLEACFVITGAQGIANNGPAFADPNDTDMNFLHDNLLGEKLYQEQKQAVPLPGEWQTTSL